MLWCIGDIHGKVANYEKLVSDIHLVDSDAVTVQLGDLGFGFLKFTPPVLSDKDFYLTGNHDNIDECISDSHCLGHFGIKQILNYKCFFIRGAFSIDVGMRTPGISWWANEQLSYEQLLQAIDLYKTEKPDIVLSHDCPDSIRINEFLYGDKSSTKTSSALESMFQSYQPKMWIFGHHHRSFNKQINGTRFICLNELEYISI